jgi:hypothetical protein
MQAFISHASDDAKLANTLKEWLETTFLGRVDVFVSSAPEDISAGEKWFSKIENALTGTRVLVVLCSLSSVNRAWINFEAGAGWIKGIPVIPVCYSGVNKNTLPAPLSFFQALNLENEGFSAKLISAVSKHLGFSKTPRISYAEMQSDIESSISTLPDSDNEEDDLGFLDHLVRMEDGFQTLVEVVGTVSEATSAIRRETIKVSDEITLAKQNPTQGTSKHVQKLARGLGKRVADYSEQVAEANQLYTSTLADTSESLEAVLELQEPTSSEDIEIVESFMNQMDVFQIAASAGRKSFSELGNTMEEMPKLERHLSRALGIAGKEIHRFTENIDQTISMAARAKSAAKELTDDYAT